MIDKSASTGCGVFDDSAKDAMLGTLSSILSHVSYSSGVIADMNLNAQGAAQLTATLSDGQVQFVNALWMLTTKLSELQESVATLVKSEGVGGGDMMPPTTFQAKSAWGIASATWEPLEVGTRSAIVPLVRQVRIASACWEHTDSSQAEHVSTQGIASSSTYQDLLVYGAVVKFVGLQARSELNGALGNINSFDSSRQRYIVTIQSTLEKTWFKRSNLEVVENDSADVESDGSNSSSRSSRSEDSNMMFATSEEALARLAPDEREDLIYLKALSQARNSGKKRRKAER
jgi:hypothetical protein